MDNQLIKIKILIVGDTKVGKTSFIYRYINNEYKEGLQQNIGVEFHIKDIKHNIRLYIWDVIGVHLHVIDCKDYFQFADVVIIMFDLTNYKSFTNVNFWFTHITQYCKNNIIIILIGNKFDLVSGSFNYYLEELNNLTIKNNIKYFQVCVKTGYNVDEVFNYITNLFINQNKIIIMLNKNRVKKCY